MSAHPDVKTRPAQHGLPDGVVMVNLGCGTRTSPYCINLDWSPYLRLKASVLGRRLAPLILRGNRAARFRSLADSIIVHDLRRRLPFADSSVDVVYHSHVLEHLDRSEVPAFLLETRRVLREGGVHRIVVPNLEVLARRYLAELDDAVDGQAHDATVGAMIEQMVRRAPAAAADQRAPMRLVECLVLGDARRRGETHQWMWDRCNLAAVLADAGFRDVQQLDHRASRIPDWDRIGLDAESSGEPNKPGSLYIEALA